MELGTLTSADGTSLLLRHLAPEAPSGGALIIVHGFGEHCGRYEDFMRATAKAGLDTYAIDLRGHGKSGGSRGYVRSYEDYFADVDALYAEATKNPANKGVILFGHSMGGLIALRYAEQQRRAFTALMLSAPFLGRALKVNPLKLGAGQLLGRLAPKIALAAGIDGAMVTHDPTEAALYDADPLLVSKVTAGWFVNTEREQQLAYADAPKLSLPLYWIHGEADPIASLSRSRETFGRAASVEKTFVPLPGFRHEPLHEVERKRIAEELANWAAGRFKAA